MMMKGKLGVVFVFVCAIVCANVVVVALVEED